MVRRAARRAARLAAAAPTRVLLAILLAGGVALRCWYLTTPQARLDGDEAMTGLMVRHILHGHTYAFLADQSYNGSPEQYLQAAVALAVPLTAFTLRLVEVALWATAALLVYAVGRRLLPSRGHALLAVALFAVGPYFEIWKGVRSHGAYPSAQVVGLVGILAALAVSGSPREQGRRQRWWATTLGLAAGVGAWAALSSAYLLVPAVLWFLADVRRRPALGLSALAGAVVGFGPTLAWMAHNRMLPGIGGPQPTTTVAQRLVNLADPVARELVGVGTFHGRPGWPVVAQDVAVALLCLAWLVAVGRRRHGIAALLRLRTDRRRPGDLLLLVPPVVVVLWITSKYAWWTGEPRYLFAVYPALALGLAALVPRARPGPRWRGPVTGGALFAVFAATSLTTLAHQAGHGPAYTPACLRTVAAYLRAHGETVVYADYWIGMPLDFAEPGITAAPWGGGRGKFPPLRWAADTSTPVYVAGHVRDPMGEEPDNVATVDAALRAHGVGFRRTDVACVSVFDRLQPPLRPWQIGVGKPMPPELEPPVGR